MASRRSAQGRSIYAGLDALAVLLDALERDDPEAVFAHSIDARQLSAHPVRDH
jgi:hypothetical protein